MNRKMDPGVGMRAPSRQDNSFGATISQMARAREGYRELASPADSRLNRERGGKDQGKIFNYDRGKKQADLKDLLSGNRQLSNGLSQNKPPPIPSRPPSQNDNYSVVVPRNKRNVNISDNIKQTTLHRNPIFQEKSKQIDQEKGAFMFKNDQILMPKIPRLVPENESNPAQISQELKRINQKYFGEAGKATANLTNLQDKNTRIVTDLVHNLRNPTLGELLRNKNTEPLQPSKLFTRRSAMYSSEKHLPSLLNEPSTSYQDESLGRKSSSEENLSSFLSKPGNSKNINPQPLQKPSVGLEKIRDNLQGVACKNTFVYYSKDKLSNNDTKRSKIMPSRRVLQVSKKLENGKTNYCLEHQRRANNGTKEDGTPEKLSQVDKFKRNSAYPDHPERDSLDGNLPGSSHGTGNPPPPPAAPSTGGEINSNPSGAPGFTKGPNAKNKKHKKLKNDAETVEEKAKAKERDIEGGKKDEKEKDLEPSGGGYRTRTEPYTHLWVVMSEMYGKLVVLLMLAFCLTEVMGTGVEPLMFQGIFLMYLYVGSIVAIMCIYVTVIVDNCPSLTGSKENLTKAHDPEAVSISSFGTLKRAHITRAKTSRTSFYLRIGALVFGLGTLIFNGLEIAMHSTLKGDCVEDIVFAHPIMQALFTFLQMHFLFVNSEVIVEKFGQIARFGFMHLVATNLAIWTRMVVWESASDWIEKNYSSNNLRDAPDHAQRVLQLYSCFNNNTLGRAWTNAQPFLFPFLVQYSLIAAAVTYIMWCNVGKAKLQKNGQLTKKALESTSTLDKRMRRGRWKVDCRSASKGLFMGLLVLVGGIVILIIFFVMKDDKDFLETKMFWICNGTQMSILSLSIISTIIGFVQIPKLSVSTTEPLALDKLLLSSTILGVYVFAIFSMIVGGLNHLDSKSMATFCTHALLLVQVSLQGMLVAEASRRTCATRYQMLTKPGRQVITFLLFSNVTLWILDTFMTHSTVSQAFQINFYGVLAWGVISRISLPLMILYRFHSAVILVEIWKNTYRTKTD